jgi:uncharacterized protein
VQLRTLLGEPSEIITAKVRDRLNPLTRRFVECSTFVCVATADAAGNCDVSPRGDPAGFVRVLDDRTLLLPERPGNRLADSLSNLLSNPRIGLMFVVPGIGDTLRVNGRGTITDDQQMLAGSAVQGRMPRLGILVAIQSAYTHCPKAFLRADLWNPATHMPRSQLPSSGQIHRLFHGEDFDADAYDAATGERYARRENFY